jgi:outer membrane protein TolC
MAGAQRSGVGLPARARPAFGLSFLCLGLLVTASCKVPYEEGWDQPVGVVRMKQGLPSPAPAQPPVPEGAPAVGAPGAGVQVPLSVTVEGAILLALENNRDLAAQRLGPAIQQTFEGEQRGVFDPMLSGGVSWSRERAEGTSGGVTTEDASARAALDQFLPTGTDLGLQATAERAESSTQGDSAQTRLGLTVTQALLRGMGVAVNLVSLRQARLDTMVSQYELRGFAEALVAQVESTYWDYALAERQIEIFTDSLKLAEQQLAETQDRISIGKLAEIELAAAQAEVALRREALINARSLLATTRLRLLRLLNPPGTSLWGREIKILEEPQAPAPPLEDIGAHVEVARRMRPELNEARLGIEQDDLELVRTRNGLLPRLDLFITLGKSGYAHSFINSAGDLGGPNYDVLLGGQVQRPLENLAAKARHRRATLNRRQAEEALANLEQLVELDVRSAYIEVDRAREQVAATAATRKLQEETLRGETEKFRVGKSTTFLVARAQRDLVASQIDEVAAAVSYRKALVEFYSQEGSLLVRRGVEAPGEGPPGQMPWASSGTSSNSAPGMSANP